MCTFTHSFPYPAPPEEPGEQPALKRKKTVVWADGEGLALATDLAAVGGKGIAVGGADRRASALEPTPVVVLPADDLYVEVDVEQLLRVQAEAPIAAEGQMPRASVLRRRLECVERLAGLYEQQLWALLDELRLRHAQFLRQPGMSLLAMESPSAERQQQQRHQQQVDGQPSSMRELWQRHMAASLGQEQEQEEGEDELQQPPGAHQWQQQQQQLEQQGDDCALAVAAADTPALPGTPAATSSLPPAALAPEAAALPLFEELESLLVQLPAEAAAPPGGEPALEASLRERKAELWRALELTGALEQGCLASLARELDRHGAMAALVGRANRWLLRQGVVVLGRSTGEWRQRRCGQGGRRRCSASLHACALLVIAAQVI